MKSLLTIILVSLPITTFACGGYVIGFKGMNDVFDSSAFSDYVKRIGYCSKLYSWNSNSDAVKFIQSLQVPYQLYGYSQGAATVSRLVKNTELTKPEYVLTIGAYKTTDVNFDKFNIKYANYFDNSGKGQRSPGVFLNVSHDKIQKEVNKIHKN